ncbi:MAG: UbiA family prenyltransferase, partial [Pseudonocardia sp.]|nr:UbiA family prenyltransferase [Pseudonocardia sp.]
VLVANNLRDIGSDAEAGKRTLAVLLGDTYTRWLYAALLGIPFLLSLLAGLRSLPMLIGLLGAPLAISPVRRVLGGAGGGPAHGAALVAVLGDTAMVMLAWSLGTAVGLALGMLA